MKKCIHCAEEVQDEAIKCRHCGELFDGKREVRGNYWVKFSGACIMFLGMVVFGYFHSFYDTSVSLQEVLKSDNRLLEGKRVHNMGRMAEQKTGTTAGLVFFVIGAGITIAGYLMTSRVDVPVQKGTTDTEPEKKPFTTKEEYEAWKMEKMLTSKGQKQ